MEMSRRTLLAAAASAGALAATGAPSMAAAPLGGAQAPGFSRFKVGDFEVIAVHDGMAMRDIPPGFVRSVPDAEVAKAYEEIGVASGKMANTFTAIVVNTGKQVVLIDTGFADNGGPTTGRIASNLQAAGIAPKDVDVVLLSHFHGDHIMGLRSKDGALVYPNAEIRVPEAEWAFWMDDAKMGAAPEGLKGNFAAVRKAFGADAGKVARFAWGKEAVPGITAMQADGHTPGHTAYDIVSGSGRLIFVGDITNNPSVFARRPDWSPVFDMDPQQAIATRKRMLDMAAADNIQLSFYHAGFPATGFVAKSGDGYAFQQALWTGSI
jgi:glyoxylase-like metal-dependent hydrolase (beta-lactamase superfamily II)